MRKLRTVLAATAALFFATEASAGRYLVEGTLPSGASGELEFNTVFWRGLSGYVEFEGAELEGVTLTSSTTQIFYSFVTGAKSFYPISGGCTAQLGQSCDIPDPYPFVRHGITQVQSNRFDFSTPDAWFFRNSLYSAPQGDPGVYKLVTPGVHSTFTLSFAPQDVPSEIRYRAVYISNAIPEPETWALMIVGFGAAGLGLRARRRRYA